MKRITYSVGVLTMSMLVYYPFQAYASGGIPNDTVMEGMHFDLGAQGNVEFSSVKYNDNSLNDYNDPAKPPLFSDMHIKSHKTHVTPSIFAGMRYYLPRNMFWGFHIGDNPLNKQVLKDNYRSPKVFDEAIYEINAKLARINSLYGKLSFGLFITPKTDININGLLSWDLYKLQYTRDGYDVNGVPKHTGHLTNSDSFSWWGYGFGLGVDRYFSDHVIASLNYAFVMHNSKNRTLDSYTGSGGELDTLSPAPIKFKNMHEHIISVALMYEL
jgi:hypothetical protein